MSDDKSNMFDQHGTTPATAKPMGSSTPSPVVATASKPSDGFVLTARQYAEEYVIDSDRHVARYRNKTVELTGRIVGGSRLIDGDGLELQGTERKLYVVNVQCVCREPEPWKRALPGRTVRVRGIGPDKPLGARIVQAEILEVTGPDPTRYTADELSRAVRGDPARFATENRSSYFVVTGEVASISENILPLVTLVTLRTTDKPTVVCTVSMFNVYQLEKLGDGDNVRFVGQCSTVEGEISQNAIRMIGCLRLQ